MLVVVFVSLPERLKAHFVTEHYGVVLCQTQHDVQRKGRGVVGLNREDGIYVSVAEKACQSRRRVSEAPQGVDVTRAVNFVLQHGDAKETKILRRGASVTVIEAQELIVTSEENAHDLLEDLVVHLEGCFRPL